MAAPEEFQSLIDSLVTFKAGLDNTRDRLDAFGSAVERVQEFNDAAARAQTEIDKLKDKLKSAANASEEEKIKKKIAIAEQEKLTASKQALRTATDELREAKKAESAAAQKAVRSAAELGGQFLKISTAGIDLAKSLGTTATQGVQLELDNRKSIASQIGRVETDRMATLAEQSAAQKALTSTFISTAEGSMVSAEGTTAFLNSLKGGFKSNFELTGESLRGLAIAGISTEAQMENFRKSSGRASLSSDQFGKMVNSNSLSFLLYGNSFAKAAANAEKAGIALASIQGAQESMVSNLDNVVDTVAQLNQLGSNVDFGSLVQKLEMEGPDAVLEYLSSAIPGDLMQSTSFRALVGQLGIPAETLLKQQKVGSAADSIEAQFTKAGKEAGGFAKTLTSADRGLTAITSTFGGVITSAITTAISLYQLKVASDLTSKAMLLQRATAGGLPTGVPGATSAVATAGTTTPPAVTGATAASTLSKSLSSGPMMGGAKAGGALGLITGAMTGIAEYQQTGSIWKGIFRGLANLAGSVIGGALGAFGGPIGIMLGSMAGSYVGDAIYKMFTKSDDLFSMGYGQRVLMGPEGNFALNNRDTVLAGTNLFGQSSSGGTSMSNISPAGMTTTENRALSPAVTTLPALTPAGTSLRTGLSAVATPQGSQFGAGLEKKLDDLLLMLKEAKTTITIDGAQQKVPRLQLVQVNSRNEVM